VTRAAAAPGRGRGSRAAILFGLASLAGMVGCAPAHDAEQLFRQLQSPDAETRQEANQELESIVEQGDYKVFLRGIESADRIYRAQSMIYLARVTRPEARAALRDLLRVDRRIMLPFNPIRLKPTTEESDSRILAANLIAQTGGDAEAIVVLTAGLQDQPPEVLEATGYAVGALRDPKGIPFLATETRSPEIAVVRAAVQALGHFREPGALEALKGVVSHPSLEVRTDLLGSLELQSGPAAEEVLKSIGVSDPSPEMRAAAIEKLGGTKDRSLVPYLIDRLRDRQEPPRQAALEVLGQMTGQRLGPRRDRWERWWSQNQTSFTAHG